MLADLARWVQNEVEDAASFRQRISRSLRATISALPTDDAREFVRALAPHASDPAQALDALETMPTLPVRLVAKLDIEHAIELGELQLETERARSGPWSRRTARAETPYTRFGLAAAYHHRGCVAWQRGDADGAQRDVASAIELDPYARYLTSAALFAERRGLLSEALMLHDRAVAAIQPPEPELASYGADGIHLIEEGDEPPPRAARDAARTLHARGALLTKLGRAEEARRDLQASIARLPTAGAERALSALPPLSEPVR